MEQFVMVRTSSLSQMTVNILFVTVPFVSVILEHQKFPKVKSVQDCQRFVYGAMDTEKKRIQPLSTSQS